jgi:biofilm protein TabA
MVLDTLARCHRYTPLHPAFPRAFEFLTRSDWAELVSGAARAERHDIDGDRLYVSIDRMDGRGHDGARLEAHRRYIDIQLTIEGREEIGWKPLGDCAYPAGPFDALKDIGLFSDRPESWLSLPAGHFAIFFPDDAHAPLGGRGTLKKAIMKIAVE